MAAVFAVVAVLLAVLLEGMGGSAALAVCGSGFGCGEARLPGACGEVGVGIGGVGVKGVWVIQPLDGLGDAAEGVGLL